MLEQHRAEATALMVVTHDESDLGLLEGWPRALGVCSSAAVKSRWRVPAAVVTGDGDKLAVHE